ncbi:AAA family ATPase [Breoghania sp. L-A4]|uniref:Lon protease family protein n=1 Tax=Breoghania sp. L-A4 TaxID=2304600 RepID=UPI000E3600DD|nr:AAA family ATPase [Breoghania sp. L-A4]AXS42404.1 ATP-dependent protease [Breoghania sp. L-A4]
MISPPSTGTAGKLAPDALYRRCVLGQFSFKTTEELADVPRLVGQDRAFSSIDFGTRIRRHGYNLFVIGTPRLGRHTSVSQLLEERARAEKPPGEWVYVHNFAVPDCPQALELPYGRALAFRDAMEELIDDLRSALAAVFESEDYQNRRNAIDEAFHQHQEEGFAVLKEKADAAGVAILKTPMGFALAPMKDGSVIPPETFNALPEEEREGYKEKIQTLQAELEAILKSIPNWDKERRSSLRDLNREIAMQAVGQSIAEMVARFSDLPVVLDHLERVKQDLSENVDMFVGGSDDGGQGGLMELFNGGFDRYLVNVLVPREDGDASAPVVTLDNPTMLNLVGRVEHVPQQGALITNFLLVKAGALHRANGGYLVLDARQVLGQPLAWDALKRALKARRIAIESPADYFGGISTISLRPEPVPLEVKVVMIGERWLYHLLCAIDPETRELFKVVADFEDDIDRDDAATGDFACFLATACRQNALLHLDPGGVGRVVEHASRLAEDAHKLTLEVGAISDLLSEADFWAREDGASVITATAVQRAIDEQEHRVGRLRERMQEYILRDIARIETTGSQTGQINGLSVIMLGAIRFGRPSRITARVRMGTGKLVDIEREVELGGPLHSKGVMILSGYLSGRYALEDPMSLAATLVFEQSYGGVDGDSASAAELFTLLSSLSETPLRQDLAVTGSVDQRGQIQAIGGANDKIEGFFDICKARGLTGQQGVIIPRSNVQHLMLRADVVEACEAGQFAVYAIETIDEGMALLTGLPAGERGADGTFPQDSVNRRVEDRLKGFADKRRTFAKAGSAGEDSGKADND